MYVYDNPNPDGLKTGDCVVRALSVVLDQTWEYTYMDLVVEGLKYHDMPSANWIWGGYLRGRAWKRSAIPDTCQDCYTVKDFCRDHPKGRYILATGTHVIAVIDGDYIDNWDSGEEIPVFYWREP